MKDTQTTLRPLYASQEEIITRLRASLGSRHKRPMVQAPTGSGKTVLAAHVVSMARDKGNRVCFVVPFISLINQTFDRFQENGIDPADMGVIQANHPWRRPDAPIQIATSQTLARREVPETDLVIVDEAHRCDKAIFRWMGDKPDLIFIGLSATPWTKGLGKYYDDLINVTSTRDLINEGKLSDFQVFAPSHPDLSAVKVQAGDFQLTGLSKVMAEEKMVGDVVTTWLEHRARHPDYFGTLCFAVDRNHARRLRDRFEDAGIAVAYVDANTERDERDEIGRKMMAGEIEVVCNIGTLTTGIDWDVRCLVLARPTKSEMLFVQMVGRALRTAEGKDKAIILDHTDTHLNLGMVTDIDFDELCDGDPKEAKARREKKRKKLPLPKECLSCSGLVPVGERECPSCGAMLPVTPVREGEGELLAFNGTQIDRLDLMDDLRAMGKQSVYSQLLAVRYRKGYQDGWVKRSYREIFGTWPRSLEFTALPETPQIRAFVLHKAKKWTQEKARQAEERRNYG